MHEEQGKIAFTQLTRFAFSRAPGTSLGGELYKKASTPRMGLNWPTLLNSSERFAVSE